MAPCITASLRRRLTQTLGLLLTLLPPSLPAVEQLAYDVIATLGEHEIRRYEPAVRAEVTAAGTRDEAVGEAFRILFRYIGGANDSDTEIAMTAPVTQVPGPVSAQTEGERWRVAFYLPEGYAADAAPTPESTRVTLRATPPRTLAAITFSGFWSDGNFEAHEAELRRAVDGSAWEADGEATYAYYNAPFVPWFMRRNEVLLPVRRIADSPMATEESP